jgi:hypothetical protein
MISVAKVQRRNAWRYFLRGVGVGSGNCVARKRRATVLGQPVEGIERRKQSPLLAVELF